jgi:hypothetical protein
MRRFTILLMALALAATTALPAVAGSDRVFHARLRGANEVPAVDSDGVGHAIVSIAQDEESVEYLLQVARLEGIVQAHIHLGTEGVNGPVVAFLFGPVLEGTDVRGKIATGTITAADLVGPLAGQPLSALIEAIRSGDAYVNVHTLAHPMGEIRGQLG